MGGRGGGGGGYLLEQPLFNRFTHKHCIKVYSVSSQFYLINILLNSLCLTGSLINIALNYTPFLLSFT